MDKTGDLYPDSGGWVDIYQSDNKNRLNVPFSQQENMFGVGPRLCKCGCGESMTGLRPNQKFFNKFHRNDYYNKLHKEREANQVNDRRNDNKKRFNFFHLENLHVYREIKLRILLEITRGATYVSMKWVVEDMRRDTNLKTSGKPYKINNTFTSFYSAMYVEDFPEHKYLFRMRSGA